MTIEDDPTLLATEDLLDVRLHIFKAKASNQQKIPLKMDAFRFKNTGEP